MRPLYNTTNETQVFSPWSNVIRLLITQHLPRLIRKNSSISRHLVTHRHPETAHGFAITSGVETIKKHLDLAHSNTEVLRYLHLQTGGERANLVDIPLKAFNPIFPT